MAMKELDRFDTTARRAMTLQTKLIGLIGGCILLCGIVVAFVSLTVFDKKLIQNTQDELRYTEHGAKNVMQDWISTLALCSDLLSDSPSVMQVVSHSGNNGMNSYLQEKVDELDLDFVAVVDSSGIVVATSSSDLAEGQNVASVKCVSNALKGNMSKTYESAGTVDFAALAASPVKNNGNVIGCVVSGYDLTDGYFTELMQNTYNVESTVFKGYLRVSSTIPNATGTELDNQSIIDQVLYNGETFEGKNIIRGKSYYSTYQPLTDDDGTVQGMLFVAKDVEVVNAVKMTTLYIVIPIVAVLIILLMVGSYSFIHWLMWRIYNVTNFLKELETGEADLTKRCKLFIRDEIGDLIIHFDLFLDKLQQIMRDVQTSKGKLNDSGTHMVQSADNTAEAISQIITNIDGISSQIVSQRDSVLQTAAAVNDISQNITGMDQLVESQSSGVADASSAVEQMIGNISSVNQSVDKMADSFQVLASDANNGFNKQQDANEKIKQIENQSEMLVEANSVISNIAEQTNLLAMNAAIEAAHAGEAGKGFAVVADEIRKLSETSTTQSKTIGEQLNNIKNSIMQVVNASRESSEAFASVSARIKETDELVIHIKSAMQEQNAGSKLISNALRNMNESTLEVHKASKEMSAQNEKIKTEMTALQDMTDKMTQSMDTMSVGAQKINETGSVLGSISSQMTEAIEKIGSQIDLFKV